MNLIEHHFSVASIQFIKMSPKNWKYINKIHRRFRESLRERLCPTFWQAGQKQNNKENIIHTAKDTIEFSTQDDPYTILTIFLFGRPRLSPALP